MRTRLAAVWGLLVLALVLSAGAQVPQFINYQGRLLEGATLVNGNVALSLRLYAASAGGPVLYEDSNTVSVVDGLYSTHIGDNTVSGTLAGALTNAEVWLEVAINGTALSPRERMTSVAYALASQAAQTAALAQGVAAGAITGSMIASGAVQGVHLAAGSVGGTAIATGAVGSAAIARGAVTADKVSLRTNGVLLVSLPDRGTVFAPVAPDRFLATGATNRTFLCDHDGNVLVAFTNADNNNGTAVAAVGTQYVAVGCEDAFVGSSQSVGVAYLSSLDGTLRNTITNPVPDAWCRFGHSVAAVGDGALVVGAYGENVPGQNRAGSAFLFSTNGALRRRIDNPLPNYDDRFGFAVAGVGPELLVVGAPYDDDDGQNAGMVHLYHTNGTLRLSITNPTPHAFDYFGSSVAGVGREHFVVGGGTSAYLFSTNGALLVTITNQGNSVFEIASDKFLVLGSTRAGIYDTAGTPLAAITNLSGFGASAAAVGSDRIAIASDDGRVFLYSLDGYADGLIAEGVRGGSVSANMLADGAVTQDKLAARSVGTSALATGAVNSVAIADGMVSNVDIAVGTITGDRIVAGTFVRVAGDTMTGSLTNQQSVSAARFVNPANPVVPATGIALGGTNNAMASTASFGVIGGGTGNTIEDGSTYAAVGGGRGNRIEYNSDYAFIGGGIGNLVPTGSQYSVIGGGYSNQASLAGVCITIGGGSGNTVGTNSDYSSIVGGIDNIVAPDSGRSTIGGGSGNTVGTNSDYSTIAGGLRNAIGDGALYAFAAGRRAKANHQGAFVWGDSTDADVTSTESNSVTFRCQGGVRFLNSSGTLFATWVPGAASWTIVSDRAQKEGVEPVDPKAVLEKVAALPISEWNYAGYPQRHIGPMAQDLHAAFPLGGSDKAIDSGDLPGIALAAIQGLKAEIGGQRSEIESLKAENEKLKALVEALKARLDAMETSR